MQIISLVLVVALMFVVMASFNVFATGSFVFGDVNGDGSTNAKDSFALRKYLAGYEIEINKQAADCNGDSTINAKDSLMLRKHNAGYDVWPSEPTDPVQTAKWNTMYNWENDVVGAPPVAVITECDGNTNKVVEIESNFNSKIPESSKAIEIKSNTMYASPSIWPTLFRVDSKLLETATNMRVSLKIIQNKSIVQVFYIGLKFGGKTYYHKIINENYSEFGYFYFVGKNFVLRDDNKTQILITKDNLKDIRNICTWVETDKQATMYLDDIECYDGANGYDSTNEDSALPKPFEKNDGVKRYIALSFDDGPTINNMNSLLNVIEENDAPATFFLTGKNINEQAQAVMKRAVDLNCELGNHTFSHGYLTNMTKEKIREELDSTTALIEQFAGVTPVLLRPPFLAVNSNMFSAAQMINIGGYCPTDYNGTSLHFKFEYIKNKCGDGSVILLHDTVASNTQLIELVIPYYQELGYEFVTISDMFDIKGIQPRTDYMYNDIF